QAACVEDRSARRLAPSSAAELLRLPRRRQGRMLLARDAIRRLPEWIGAFVHDHVLPPVADVGAGTVASGARGLRTNTANSSETADQQHRDGDRLHLRPTRTKRR